MKTKDVGLGAPAVIAVDDGYDETKVFTIVDGKPVAYSVPSWAQDDAHVTDLSGETQGDWYEVDGQRWLVGEGAYRPVATRVEGYHTSPVNRAIVLHAVAEGVRRELLPATVLSEPVDVVLGLPVASFFTSSGAKNDALIQRKIAGFSEQGAVRARDGARFHPKTTYRVYAQAVAAWVDHVLGNDGGAKRPPEETIAVVDVGGNTTDFALLRGRGRIDHKSSGTEEVGVLHVLDQLNSKLAGRHGFNSVLSTPLLRQLLASGKGRIFGRDVDCHDFVSEVKAEAARRVGQNIVRYIGSHTRTAEIDAIVVVGGGAETVLDLKELRKTYPQLVVPEDPRFANARGGWRYRMFVDRWAQAQQGQQG